MTDKEQIIIDGIDVSECDHFREGYCLTGTGVCYKCDTNCQYAAFYLKEQLAHKTQECEALKKRNEDDERFYLKQYAKKDSEVLDLTHKLNVKTQECEELKKRLMQNDEVNTFFNTPIEGWSSDPCNICESKNNYEQLKQECENLKAEEKYLKQCCEKAGEELAKHSFEYDGKEKNLVVQAMELNEKYEKLENALEEIETELSHGFTTIVFYRILDIINQAKKGE